MLQDRLRKGWSGQIWSAKPTADAGRQVYKSKTVIIRQEDIVVPRYSLKRLVIPQIFQV